MQILKLQRGDVMHVFARGCSEFLMKHQILDFFYKTQHSERAARAAGSYYLANWISFSIGIMHLGVALGLLVEATKWHMQQLNSLNKSSSILQLTVGIGPGMFLLSGLVSSLLWPIYIIQATLKLVRKNSNDWLYGPPYFLEISQLQRHATKEYCDWISKIQNKITYECLQFKLPNELIREILEYLEPSWQSNDCFTPLPVLDHGKELTNYFSFLSPHYIVFVHKSALGSTWLLVCSKEIFMMAVFLVGYISVLRFIWAL